MRHNEWIDLKIIADENNPFSTLYEYPNGERFYIEAPFYTQLQGLKDINPIGYHDVLLEMARVVKENKKVVFTMDFELPSTHNVPDYIFLEITDLTDPLGIYIEDKSRGSDYGD